MAKRHRPDPPPLFAVFGAGEPVSGAPPAPRDPDRIVPPDQDARDFAVDPHHHVVLEASAGTGKTSVLVRRYLNLLQAGVTPAHILAITFTRKAAAEMRERIITQLRRDALYMALGPRGTESRVIKPGKRDDAIGGAQARLLAAVDGIERGEFPPRPRETHLCTRCGFAIVCRKDYVSDGEAAQA